MADPAIPAAVLAGLLSFLSPVRAAGRSGVPGAARGGDRGRVRWCGGARATRTAGCPAGGSPSGTALAYVAGFGVVFTVLGITASYVGGFLAPHLPWLRAVGGALLIVLGLQLAGVVRIPLLAPDVAAAGGGGRERARAAGTRGRGAARVGPARGTRQGLTGAFALGAVFAIGWTPCIGPTLGAIFGLAALGQSASAGVLFAAYSIGLGIPFVVLALALDEAPRLIRPLRRHARAFEIVGGALVALVGVAILFDWLPWIASRFGSLVPIP